jgi:hypothetical protein
VPRKMRGSNLWLEWCHQRRKMPRRTRGHGGWGEVVRRGVGRGDQDNYSLAHWITRVYRANCKRLIRLRQTISVRSDSRYQRGGLSSALWGRGEHGEISMVGIGMVGSRNDSLLKARKMGFLTLKTSTWTKRLWATVSLFDWSVPKLRAAERPRTTLSFAGLGPLHTSVLVASQTGEVWLPQKRYYSMAFHRFTAPRRCHKLWRPFLPQLERNHAQG